MNNRNLIVNFRPFILNQEILVYVDGACVHQEKVTHANIVDSVERLCKQYDINRINLCGNGNMLSKYAAQLNNKFSDTNKVIEISTHNMNLK